VRAAIRRFLLHATRDTSLHRRRGGSGLTSLVPRFQTIDSAFLEARLPNRDRLFRCSQRDRDPRPSPAVGQRENQLRSKYVTRGQRARLRPFRKLFPLNLGDLQQIPIAWHNIQACAAR
jgi:hypothetical protein